MIEIDDGFYVNPFEVSAIKTAGKDKCVLYLSGQSALEGFVIERDALEAATDILEAMNDNDEDEETEEEEDDNKE
jgi:hypothetical protein